jgi:hypothetical protein
MSFWARSSLAGTYNVLLKSHDGTAQGFSSAFTLVADTWKKISVTIPGNSSITINNDNGIGLRCYVVPHLGTDYTTSGHTSDAWQTLDNNNLVPDYAQNWSNTASATFDMTGWQVEVGQVSTPFPHEDIGTTLAKCQRYYQRIQCDTAYDAIMDGFHLVASQFYAMHTFPVSMRDVPTMGESGTISIVSNGADRAPDSFILNRATKEVIQTFCDMSTNNGTTGHGGQIRNNNDADQFVEFKSEL